MSCKVDQMVGAIGDDCDAERGAPRGATSGVACCLRSVPSSLLSDSLVMESASPGANS